MYSFTATAALICSLVLVAANSVAAVSLPRAPSPDLAKRQIVVPTHGFTAEPANDSIIQGDADFDFLYYNSNYCHSGYSQISVYLSTSVPTNDDVTNEGGLADGSYVVDFGTYLIANFGLPPMQPTPPPTLVMPTLGDVASGTTLFFSVVETYNVCPGHIEFEYGLETTTIVYD
ncbi:hypothetical protein GY45DRAFT_1285588 [Cubamyces sp. BRFM 1775]|nr:hypothetical protein GY45DRAFT_1285588 [Cubamyces sp. BRFM 1775]